MEIMGRLRLGGMAIKTASELAPMEILPTRGIMEGLENTVPR